jgi:cardiolipin synthase A/B
VGILDKGVAQKLDAIFEKYVARAEEIKLEKWRRRSVFIKIKDNAAYLLNDIL